MPSITDKERWINETQMFQRVAKVPQSSAEELGAEWDTFNNPRKKHELRSIGTLRVVQDQASKAALSRTN